MLKCVTCVAIPFVVTVPNKWRKTGHVFAISTGGQEWVSVETVYSQNDGRHNSQAPGLCFSRDVLLEDIRQHIVHNCQEIEQLCGLCPVKLEQGMCCNTSQSAQKRRYCVPVGNNCSAEKNQNVRKQIAIMLTCTAPWGILQLLVISLLVYLPLYFGGEIHHVYQFPGRDCKSAFDIKSQY